MVLSFRTDNPGKQCRFRQDCRSSLIRRQSLHCLPFLLHLWNTLYSMIKPHCSKFGIIAEMFLGVQIFQIFKVHCSYIIAYLAAETIFCRSLSCFVLVSVPESMGASHSWASLCRRAVSYKELFWWQDRHISRTSWDEWSFNNGGKYLQKIWK